MAIKTIWAGVILEEHRLPEATILDVGKEAWEQELSLTETQRLRYMPIVFQVPLDWPHVKMARWQLLLLLAGDLSET